MRKPERGSAPRVPMTFEAKSVLITGGTTGIGAALARAFASAGASVMITGRDRGRGEGVVGEARDAGGVADFVEADLTHPGACETVVERTRQHFGALHVLVNNAAVHHRFGTLETGDEHWLETMTVNVDAVFFLSRAAANAMKAGGGGAIVNIASQLGLYAHAGKVSYCVSKAAVIQMTRAMALDLAPHGIRVNAVGAGITRTEMLERGIRNDMRTRRDGRDGPPAHGRAHALGPGRAAGRDRRRSPVPRFRRRQLRHRRVPFGGRRERGVGARRRRAGRLVDRISRFDPADKARIRRILQSGPDSTV